MVLWMIIPAFQARCAHSNIGGTTSMEVTSYTLELNFSSQGIIHSLYCKNGFISIFLSFNTFQLELSLSPLVPVALLQIYSSVSFYKRSGLPGIKTEYGITKRLSTNLHIKSGWGNPVEVKWTQNQAKESETHCILTVRSPTKHQARVEFSFYYLH